MPISYTKSNFREKQHVNGHYPAKQAHKIWRKIFKELLSYHILGVGSFFSRTLCTVGHKKVPLIFYDDFGKWGPISIILSLLDS